ncbi:MAG: response regulator transcription factor [Saprospiraceae bacterium]|nr:response regulator transcription factor [Saprospiraceae bacterium]
MSRILYVEDEVFLAKIVKESLEARNYEVLLVPDGALVMDQLSAFRPDLCILDIMLPSVDGYSLGESIKQASPTLPIIFVSAKNQTSDVVKGFAVGGDDYLRKPFSMDELVARIENLLRRKSRFAEDHLGKTITLGQFDFLPEELKLQFGEESFDLTHRMNEVLLYMVKHRMEVIDRRALLKELWGNDSYFNSRNLDVYVKKLRDVLAHDPSIKIITLKGVGYRLQIS